jgi:hypothetical protein
MWKFYTMKSLIAKGQTQYLKPIAQRIGRYAGLVGRESVLAGSDCGYGTWVGQAAVDPDVVGLSSQHWRTEPASLRGSSGTEKIATPFPQRQLKRQI